ncbi:hypothetical protein [Kitasatospora paranensis]|uniref:hypothetical protein n=1 Tax=Kitasatospora paranensis TaxID=258053 RepID=UPI0031EFFDC0
MIVMQPVVEIVVRDGFGLWPIAEAEPFGVLPLSRHLSSAEVGTAMMAIAGWNDADADADADSDRPRGRTTRSAPSCTDC